MSITKERGARFAQLLLRAIEDPETQDLDEALVVAELAMQDDISLALDAQGNFHGPTPPGPGWVQVGVGPQGGKVWRQQGGQSQAQPPKQVAPKAQTPQETQQPLPQSTRQAVQEATQPPKQGASQPQAHRENYKTAHAAHQAARQSYQQARREAFTHEASQAREHHNEFVGHLHALTSLVNTGDFETGGDAADDALTDLDDAQSELHQAETVADRSNWLVNAGDAANALIAAGEKKIGERALLFVHAAQAELKRYVQHRKAMRAIKGGSAEFSLSAYFAHDIFDKRAQGILNRTMTVAKELSATAKRELRDALKSADPSEMGHQVVTFVNKYRLQLADLLGTTQLAALLAGASEVAERLPPLPQAGSAPPPPPTLPPDEAQSLLSRLRAMPQGERDRAIYELPPAEQHYVQQSLGSSESIPPTRPFTPQAPPGGERVHYPIIEEAARELARKNVVTRPVFDKLDDAARQKAFTVAGVDAQETLTKIMDALAENVAEGADVEAFREKVMEQVAPGTFLSEGHLENVARTYIQRAFSDGQMTVLNQPFVRSGFPYAAYDAIHDDRVRHNHLALESLGIEKSNVYRINDPVFETFRPPWDYNDRCSWTPITIRQAAERGITEASQWLSSGVEPSPPAFVPMPSFSPPPGFQRALESAPLSIRLAATLPSAPTGPELHEDTATIDMAGSGGGLPATPGDFAVEGKHTKKPGKSKGRRGRRKRVTRTARKWRNETAALAIAAGFALDNKGQWHGPQAPGPGWVQVGEGPQHGKIWRQQGQKQTPRKPALPKPQQQSPSRLSPPTDDDFFKLPKFGAANPPKVGQQILYYDGEGGGSRLPPLRGPILEISGNKIIIRTRTGNKTGIDFESARPEPASASQARPPAQPKAPPIAAQATVPVEAQPIIQQAVSPQTAPARKLPDRFEDLHQFVKYDMKKGESDEDVHAKLTQALSSVNPGYLKTLREQYKATDSPSLARAILNRDKGLFHNG